MSTGSISRAGLIAAVAAGSVLALSQPAASTAQPVASTATVCKRDVSATIKGEHKCLGVNEWCSPADEREYERYGFVCRHYRGDTWLLHRRS